MVEVNNVSKAQIKPVELPIVEKNNNINTNLLKKDAPTDKVEISSKKSELTKEKKQQIMKEARTKAAGFSLLFGIFDTIYYGLRSDKTVAKQFNLDVEKDKDFIKDIKKKQALWTIPSIIPVYSILPGVVSLLYNVCKNPADIEVN